MLNILKWVWQFIVFLFGGADPRRKRISPQTSQKITAKWEESVKPALKTRNPSQLRQALITADLLLDNALSELFEGQSMSDRLKNAKDSYEWDQYDKIWKAHKARNSMVHDLDYEPTYFILEEAINDLKYGIEVLGVSL